MSNFRTKQDFEKMNTYGSSLAVDRHVLDSGRTQLDKTMHISNLMDSKLNNDIKIKEILLQYLKKAKTVGLTEEDKNQIILLNEQLEKNKLTDVPNIEYVETQEIHNTFDSMQRDNIEYISKYNIDISNPIIAALSEKERISINKELKEKFDLLDLDNGDYAFAAAVGAIGGLIDSIFVGTATNNLSQQSVLSKFTDDKIGNLVEKYSKLRGWSGPKGNGSNSLKSAIAFLERNAEVGYDQRYTNDFKGLDIMKGMSASNHHLLSIGHSASILGLIIGVIDILQGKATFWDNSIGKIVRVSTGCKGQVDGAGNAVVRWFDHIMSDISGASGSVGRGSGLPSGFVSVLQSVQVGNVSVKGEALSIGQLVEKMYVNGYDFRFTVATSIPVIICETLVRLWWMVKQYYYHGKDFKNSIPFGSKRELQRLLLVTSGTFTIVDVVDASIKGGVQNNPVEFLNSLNYVQLANLGYKTYTNIKLQHEHNQHVRDVIEVELKEKLDELENSTFAFSN